MFTLALALLAALLFARRFEGTADISVSNSGGNDQDTRRVFRSDIPHPGPGAHPRTNLETGPRLRPSGGLLDEAATKNHYSDGRFSYRDRGGYQQSGDQSAPLANSATCGRLDQW